LDLEQIKAADVQTVGHELNPEYSYDSKTSTNKIIGFAATQTIRVTIRKIEAVGKFF
jgi:uncharacterized protein YggE